MANRERRARELLDENAKLASDSADESRNHRRDFAELKQFTESLRDENAKVARDAADQFRDHQKAFAELKKYTESLREENLRVRESAREKIKAWADRLDRQIEKSRFRNRVKTALRRWMSF